MNKHLAIKLALLAIATVGQPALAETETISAAPEITWDRTVGDPTGQIPVYFFSFETTETIATIDSFTIDMVHSSASELQIAIAHQVDQGFEIFDIFNAPLLGSRTFGNQPLLSSDPITLLNSETYTFARDATADLTDTSVPPVGDPIPSGTYQFEQVFTGSSLVEDDFSTPGIYSLFVIDFNPNANGGGINSWSLTYTTVPTPATLPLLGAVLITCSHRRRKGCA